MNGSIKNRMGLAVAVLAVALALPMTTYAHGDYRGSGTVTVGYRDHHGHGDRHHDSGRHWGPRGHAYGHYARPYYRPYTRFYYEPQYYYVPRYYAPRYYDYGGSGWDIDLRYHFSDHW